MTVMCQRCTSDVPVISFTVKVTLEKHAGLGDRLPAAAADAPRGLKRIMGTA